MGNFLQDLDNLICAAIEESRLEDQLHSVLDCLLTTFKQETLVTDARTTVSCSIQVRTVDRKTYAELQSLRAFLTAIPDGALLLHLRRPELLPWERTRCLLSWELKRLLVSKPNSYTDANLYDAWKTTAAIARAESAFQDSIPQLLIQGFCALHAYQAQNTAYVVCLVGMYLTALRFRRPSSKALPALPRNATYGLAKKKGFDAAVRSETGGQEKETDQVEDTNAITEYTVGDTTIVSTLFPDGESEHFPEVILAGEPMVSRDGNGNIRLSDACRYVLSLAHEQGADLLLDRRPSLTFDLPSGSYTPRKHLIDIYTQFIKDWFSDRPSADNVSELSESPEVDSPEYSPYVDDSDNPSDQDGPDLSSAIGLSLRNTRGRTRAFKQAQETRKLQAYNPFDERPPTPGPSAARAPLA
ncbi:hypothetical protein VNI00_010369 [Paramarasmius palmivorus]|uniref:Uncharacterized protein n=1 Tax=Paramarasmius palmivorus TaxID=297713 RepID=A0AAW0CGA9_9AGAR